MIFQILIFSFLYFEAFDASPDCGDIPKRSFAKCCIPPKISDENKMTEIHNQQNMSALINNKFLMLCKISENYFEQMHFIDNDVVQLETVDSYIDKKVADKNWNSLLKEKFKEGAKKADDNMAQLEKLWSSWNVTKEECNYRVPSITGYTYIAININCPTSSWTDKDECTKGKEFLKNCQDDSEAMKKTFESMMDMTSH